MDRQAKVATPGQIRSWLSPATVSCAYILISIVWIVGSDAAMARISSSIPGFQRVETIKGVAFVVVTGLLLFLSLRRWQRLHSEAVAERFESEERFREFSERSPGMFWFLELNPTRLLYINQSVRRLWDLDPDTLMKDPFAFRDRLHPDDATQAVQRVQQFIETPDAALDQEVRVVHRSGDVRWLHMRGTHIGLGPNGKARVAGVTHDITEHKILQQEIAASEARFRAIAEAAPVMIWQADESMNRTYSNTRWRALAGGDARLAKLEWMKIIDPHDRGRALQTYAEAINQQHPVSQEFRIRNERGEVRWIFDTCVALRDENGALTGYLGSSMDITDAKEDRERQNLLMHELDHRVKNNLAAVIAVAESTFASTTSRESFHAALVGRIMAMARSHTALAKGRWSGLYLEELVVTVLEPLIESGSNSIRFGGDPAYLPPEVVTPLAMTLHELGTNSLKHGAFRHESGSVTLRWKITHSERDRCTLHLSWVEAGAGPQTLPRNPGLGMRIIEGFVSQELQGVLGIDAAADGLVFTISIPIGELAHEIASGSAQSSEGPPPHE